MMSEQAESSERVPRTDEQIREEEILAARIGVVRPHNAPVHLAEYDLQWPRLRVDLCRPGAPGTDERGEGSRRDS